MDLKNYKYKQFALMWFQVFLSNTNSFWTDLFDPETGLISTTNLNQDGHWINGNEKVMSYIPRDPELEPQYWMQFSAIPRTYPTAGDAVGIF